MDERAAWLRAQGAEIESGPEEYDYREGYYALFFYDPGRPQARAHVRPLGLSAEDFIRSLDLPVTIAGCELVPRPTGCSTYGREVRSP